MLIKHNDKSKGVILMLCASVCACTGQLLWKLSVVHGFLLLFSGFALYGIGAIVMILAYKYGSLSVLQPMISVNYVLALLLAGLILNETITIFKVIGVGVIIIGVILIGSGDY